MKDVLNFALTMPGVPSVMTVLMSMMLMLFAVNLAILIMVIFVKFVIIQLVIHFYNTFRCHSKTVCLLWCWNWLNFEAVPSMQWN